MLTNNRVGAGGIHQRHPFQTGQRIGQAADEGVTGGFHCAGFVAVNQHINPVGGGRDALGQHGRAQQGIHKTAFARIELPDHHQQEHFIQ